MNKPKRAENHTSKVLGDLLREITPQEQARTDKRMMLAAKIAQAIEAKGWTAKKFAAEMNQHASVISKWLSGTHNFTSDTLSDIEEKLGIELIALQEREWKVTKVVEYHIVVTGSSPLNSGYFRPVTPQPYADSKKLIKSYLPMPDANSGAQFQLRGIELHELFIAKPAPGTNPPAQFNFDLTIECNVDAPQKIVTNSVRVRIKGESSDQTLGSLTCTCIFSVANFDELVTMKTETYAEVNEAFAEALNSIAVSTTRGVMFGALKGTFLHYALLPIIDIKGLKKNQPPQN